MTREISEEVPHWKEIELFLHKRKCANLHEIADNLGIHWVTAKKEMNKLRDIGRIHKEGKTYFLNGENQWKTKVNISKNHTLFIDTFRTPFGDNFVRIKETKKD